MESSWERRELVVLRALVKHFDPVGAPQITPRELVGLTDLSPDDVARGLQALARATGDPYLSATVDLPVFDDGAGGVMLVSGVTQRALRETGAWPSADTITTELLARLADAVEQEADPEKRSRLQTAVSALGGDARAVLVGVVGGVLRQHMGL